LSFDEVFTSVPASFDAVAPQSWSSWGPDYGTSLHILQLRIALRGLALLRVGGLMAYSTCSFNPVEDEAVVAELLKRCG
jgi:tRNA (cytosine34-C5)-methyltransferase